MRAVLFHAVESARSHDGRNFGRLAKSSVKETAHCHRLADNVWLINEEESFDVGGSASRTCPDARDICQDFRI